MDDFLREFSAETAGILDTVDNQLIRLEQRPNNAKLFDNIFSLVPTIKGTRGRSRYRVLKLSTNLMAA